VRTHGGRKESIKLTSNAVVTMPNTYRSTLMMKIILIIFVLISISMAFAADTGKYRIYLMSASNGLASTARTFATTTDARICFNLGTAYYSMAELRNVLLQDGHINDELYKKVYQTELDVQALTGFCVGAAEANGGTPGGLQASIPITQLSDRAKLSSQLNLMSKRVAALLQEL
jgi:hypothetical protein